MASSPCDCWTHLTQHSLSSPSPSPSPSPSSLPQTPSIEDVWNEIKLPSLCNSPVDLEFNNHSFTSFLNQQPPSNFLTHTSTSVSVLHTRSPLSVSNANKTTQQQDQRRMRVIKNRESAVRSRARKQAYRNGLEVEIARLTEENSRLRRQLEELQCSLWSSGNHPRVGAPCRTLSSPF